MILCLQGQVYFLLSYIQQKQINVYLISKLDIHDIHLLSSLQQYLSMSISIKLRLTLLQCTVYRILVSAYTNLTEQEFLIYPFILKQ